MNNKPNRRQAINWTNDGLVYWRRNALTGLDNLRETLALKGTTLTCWNEALYIWIHLMPFSPKGRYFA